MPQERTLVSFDWAIKYLLRNKADYVILEGFLTTLLGKEIKIKSLPDSESGKRLANDKVNRVDVLAEESDGFLVVIEIQFITEMDYLTNSTPYSPLPPKADKSIKINIVYFDLGIGKDYIYHGTTTFKGLHYNDELELSPAQRTEFARLEVKDIYPEYYLLKVDRFRDIVKSKLDEWMYYLKNSSIKSDFAAPGLLEADSRLEYSRLSPEDRRSYDKHVDNRRSEKSTIYTAKLEGKAEGHAEGKLEGKAEGILQVAKKMKAEGVDIGIILKVTGLSDEDVAKLAV
ncbi:MAG: PD-(D/E)XK nuclease family transposase [Fibromonadaceae bacterium]|jgi:hypothetical protein|nr:PD-(D/E)XK nuclease family transposase [Fibromonadaceae bacterium]